MCLPFYIFTNYYIKLFIIVFFYNYLTKCLNISKTTSNIFDCLLFLVHLIIYSLPSYLELFRFLSLRNMFV